MKKIFKKKTSTFRFQASRRKNYPKKLKVQAIFCKL